MAGTPPTHTADPDARHLAIYLAEHDAPCPHCGYNLRALAAATCPECGGELTLAAVKHAVDRRQHDPFLQGILFVLILLAVLMAFGAGVSLVILLASIGSAPLGILFRLATQGLLLLIPAAVAWAWGHHSRRLRDAAPERRLAWAAAAVASCLGSPVLAMLVWWAR